MARPTFRDPQAPSVAQTLVSPPTGATLPLNQLAPEAALRRLELTIVRRLEGSGPIPCSDDPARPALRRPLWRDQHFAIRRHRQWRRRW